MPSSLKAFIKAVRSAKTIADERTVIQKESAAIRASFRSSYLDSANRRNNIAKLLYLFTLGERTHFGQIECVKLIASNSYIDKRIGYLGTMLLLDENQEILTLVTNSLNTDLNNPNQYVVALALCCLGDIASEEMARDIFTDIERLITCTNSYLKKKAALCAMRICKKAPDLEDNYIQHAKQLLKEDHHGVLLCATTLVINLLTENPNLIPQFKPFISTIVNHLKHLLSSGYAPEHDVMGISDPFLQTKLLRLLRILGKGDPSATEKMNDILTQVATNTENSKNVGNAILYEAVLTIFNIEADSSLRVLGINILGRFLSNRDNNVRYVALHTLSKVVESEPTAVQRHRNIILACLQDNDISIRKRALDLSYVLINDQNIRVLIRELLAFLETADAEFKPGLTNQICIASFKFAPNKRWHIDTIIRVLTLGGEYISDEVLSSFVSLVQNSPEYQLYAAQKLFSLIKKDFSSQGLVLAAAWVCGEYSDLLLKKTHPSVSSSTNGLDVLDELVGNKAKHEENNKSSPEIDDEFVKNLSESDFVDLFNSILLSSYATTTVKCYVINALAKAASRFTNSTESERVRKIISQYNQDMDLDLQQRSLEFGNLYVRKEEFVGVLEHIPAPTEKSVEKRFGLISSSSKIEGRLDKNSNTSGGNKKGGKNAIKNTSATDLLLDLMDTDYTAKPAGNNDKDKDGIKNDLASIFNSTNSGSNVIGNGLNGQNVIKNNNADILSLFDSAVPNTKSTETKNFNVNEVNGLSKSLQGLSMANSGIEVPSNLISRSNAEVAFEEDGLKITLQAYKDPSKDSNCVVIYGRFYNLGADGIISNINLQIAVPKGMHLQMHGISNNKLKSGEEAIQNVEVYGGVGSKVRLRLKISYTTGDGKAMCKQVDFKKFSDGLL